MTRRTWIRILVLVGVPGLCSVARSETVTLAHTPWEMHAFAPVPLSDAGTTHGDPSEYRYAPQIPQPGPDWKPLTGGGESPLNPNDINYLGPSGDYSSDLRSCLTQLEFTCFECNVTVPVGFVPSQATITLGPLDDGARVLVFNGTHPDGAVPDGGYVLLGDNKSLDLSRLLQSGAINRVVVQHVDDCAGQSWLGPVQLEVKGEASQTAVRPTWGKLKSMYR